MSKSTIEASINTIRDDTYGFRRLDPLPTPEELEMFYQSKYYDLIREGTKGRAPEIRRLMEGGEEGNRELAWLDSTLHADIIHVLEISAPGKRVLEVGCGIGQLLNTLKAHNFEAIGIEPAEDAAKIANDRSLLVHNVTLEQYVEKHVALKEDKFDAIILIHVLEHILDPGGFMTKTRDLLKVGGVICICVPNDFNEIQLIAQEKLNKKPWWLSNRDHLNYFDFPSLKRFLEGLNFEVIHSQGDFPMEMFLLMGFDYIGDPDTGSSCHQRRVDFEMSLPAELRRKIYTKMGEVGFSRGCIMFGKLK